MIGPLEGGIFCIKSVCYPTDTEFQNADKHYQLPIEVPASFLVIVLTFPQIAME